MRKNIIQTIVICGLIWSTASAQTSREAGSGRMWPGSDQTTLFRSPNPVNLQGNNIITGNVAGGRQFRGNVGYSSPFDFRGPTSSTTLDSFLRRSAGSPITETPGSYTPYFNPLASYNPRNPTLRNPSLINPSWASQLRIDGRASSTSVPSTISRESDLYRYFGQSRRISDTTSTYFLNELRQQQRTTPPQVSQYLMSGQQLTDKQRQILDQQLIVDPMRIYDEAPSLKYKQFNDEKSLQSYLMRNIDNDYLQQLKTQTQENQTKLDQPKEFDESIKQQILLLDKQIKELPQKMRPQKTQQPGKFDFQTPKKEDIESQIPQQDGIEELGLSSYRTQSVIGSDQNLYAYMERKSAEHILTGDDWLSKGKFYRASGAYSSALIYKKDPKAYAGKCHALFGAGEYMSSAFFLFLALEAYPEYAELEMDIVAAMGGRDILENRLADVEKWAQENDSPDLHFLRAYFYYRIGRIDMAKEAVDIALEKMPDSTAVAALKAAIDKKSK